MRAVARDVSLMCSGGARSEWGNTLHKPRGLPNAETRFTAASWPTVWSRYAGSGLSSNNNYAGWRWGRAGPLTSG
jgi:hypothetical protein